MSADIGAKKSENELTLRLTIGYHNAAEKFQRDAHRATLRRTGG